MFAIEVVVAVKDGKATILYKTAIFSSAITIGGTELTIIAIAAIENFVLLIINHSFGSAELESTSAGIVVLRKLVALPVSSPSCIVAICR